MELKKYVDQVPPSTGVVYNITDDGSGKSKINDVTEYEQIGSSFGASDVNKVCILECTHTKVGTVHTFTTPNKPENIKVKALYDYTVGDTFRVNDKVVQAKCLDGSPLPNKCFTVGQIMQVYLSENVLTFPFFGIESIHPVGSIYMSVENTSPAARWGGTWEQIKGRVLVGAGSPEPNTSNTFGALSGQSWSIAAKEKGGQDYHKLTVAEMPKHNHPIQLNGDELPSQSHLDWTFNANARVYSGTDLVRPTGGDAAHNNMMPYYGCYMWVRLA